MREESPPLCLWTFGWQKWFGCNFCRHVAVCKECCLFSSLPPSPFPLPLSPCSWFRCWSQMQLASQKGQQTCRHRESGSCQDRLSLGYPSSRTVWVSWQRRAWRDSERESERGRTSVPPAVISCCAAQSVDLTNSVNQPLVESVPVLIHTVSHSVFTEVACCSSNASVDIFPVQPRHTLDGMGSRQ